MAELLVDLMVAQSVHEKVARWVESTENKLDSIEAETLVEWWVAQMAVWLVILWGALKVAKWVLMKECLMVVQLGDCLVALKGKLSVLTKVEMMD